MATKEDITRLDSRIDKLDAKIDRLDTKLTKFEEHEIDKRLQLEVRVTTIEKHLGLDKKIAA
jgi:septal ring factor EnvC (AmiA/AmiB activator)